MPFLRLIALMSLVLGSAAGRVATAADAAAVEEEKADLVEYVEVNASELPSSNTIATKLPTTLQLTPANVGSVGAELMREQDAVVLTDALRNVSGLNIQSGPAVHDFFAIRGFHSLSSGLVLTDGAVEPEATFYQLYNVAGVEVLKGPGGFLYGSNALAGTVNMVRKQPLPGNFTVVGASLGSFATYEGTLDWNLAADDAARAFRLNAIRRTSDGYRDDKDGDAWAVNPSFTWKPSERSTLNFNVEVGRVEVQPDGGLPLYDPQGTGQLEIPGVSRRTSYQSPVEFSEQDLGRFQFDWEHRAGERLKLRNKLYYRGIDWQSAGSLLNGTVDLGAGPQVLRTLTTLDDEQQFVGNQFEAIFEAETGKVRHHLLGGLEVARYADEFAIAYLPPQMLNIPPPFGPVPCVPTEPGMPCIDLFDPQETLTEMPPESAFTPLASGDFQSIVIAPYVVDQIEFTPKFHVTAGARWDDIDFKDDLSGVERDDSELSPMLGLLMAPNPTLSLYGNAGRAYAPTSPRIVVVDPASLEPEQSTQLEVGVKKKWLDGRIQSTLALYEIERENIALTDDNGVTQQPGDQRSRGVEVELAAELAPRLRTIFAYAYNDAELTDFVFTNAFGQSLDYTGNTPPYAPEHLASLWISRSFTNGFGVAGGGRYFSAQFFTTANEYEIDAAVVLDAALYYDIAAWRFKLNAKNLTDEEFETGSFGSAAVVPGDGFALYGAAEVRF